MQQALLKIIEGTVANVPPRADASTPTRNTSRSIRATSCSSAAARSRGWTRSSPSGSASSSDGLRLARWRRRSRRSRIRFQHLTHDDLLKYGLIPEFVGRLPVTVALDALTRADLMRILTEPKNAVVKQYQKFFALDNVELVFTDDALEATAKQAEERKTGARGLRTTIEEVLLDVMYEIPSLENVRKCIVDDNVIINRSRPLLMSVNEQEIPYAETA